jgi:hypothetical protein
MKTIVLLCVLLSFLRCSLPAQNPPRPVDPPELIARRAEQLRAISRAQIQPLEIYLRALEPLRQQFAREGKPESAAAVDAEIKSTKEQLAAAQAASNPTTSAPAQLQIESATYGHAATNRMADVTAAIRSAVESDTPSIVIASKDLGLSGSDPAPGAHKTATIIYRINGRKKEKKFEENTVLKIKEDLR